jgi:hypothetical protein
MGSQRQQAFLAALWESLGVKRSNVATLSESEQAGWWLTLSQQSFSKAGLAEFVLPGYTSGRETVEQSAIEKNEHLESQLIRAQRELLKHKQRNETLEAQTEGQLEWISSQSRTIQALTQALLGTQQHSVRIRDVRSGRVVRVGEDYAEVAYSTPEGRVEHVYDREQFVDGKLPDEGDFVEAHAFVAFKPGPVRTWRPPEPQPGGEDEFRAFREKRETGPIVYRDPPD